MTPKSRKILIDAGLILSDGQISQTFVNFLKNGLKHHIKPTEKIYDIETLDKEIVELAYRFLDAYFHEVKRVDSIHIAVYELMVDTWLKCEKLWEKEVRRQWERERRQ